MRKHVQKCTRRLVCKHFNKNIFLRYLIVHSFYFLGEEWTYSCRFGVSDSTNWRKPIAIAIDTGNKSIV